MVIIANFKYKSVLTIALLWFILIEMEMGQIYLINDKNKSTRQVLDDTSRCFCDYITRPCISTKNALMFSIIDLCFCAYSIDDITLHISDNNFAYENEVFLKKDIFEKQTVNNALIHDILVTCHEFSHVNDSIFLKNKKRLNEYGDEKFIIYTDKCDKLITNLFGINASYIFHDINFSEQRANTNGFKIIEKLLNDVKRCIKENNFGDQMLDNVSEYKTAYFSLKKCNDDKVGGYLNGFDIDNYKQKIKETQNNYLECLKDRKNMPFSEQISTFQTIIASVDLFRNDEFVEKLNNLISNIQYKTQFIEYKKLLVACQNYKVTKEDIYNTMDMVDNDFEDVFDIFECLDETDLVESMNDYLKEKRKSNLDIVKKSGIKRNKNFDLIATNFNQENNI